MLKKKSSTTIVEQKGISKNIHWAEAIYDTAGLYYPEKDDWRKRLVYSMFEWVKNPTSLMIEDFCFEYGICRRKLTFWKDKYPDVKAALEDIKIFIGARRRKGAILNQLNGQFAYRDMHMYDSEWSQVNEYHAKLTAEARAKADK
jgi:hypothetical protein